MKNKSYLILLLIFLVLGLSIFLYVNKNIKFSDIFSPNYKAVTGDTSYYDYSDITVIPADYSFSTIFYSENTEFIIYSEAGILTQKTDVLENGKPTPYFTMVESGTIKMLITNSAVNKNGQLLDVLVTVDNIVKWEDSSYINFGLSKSQFLNSQHVPLPSSLDYELPIGVGDAIGFYWAAFKADCDFTLKYYIHGTYNNSTGAGTLGGINKVNSFYYDIDVENIEYPNRFLNGYEGIAPQDGKSNIYYNKNGKATNDGQTAHLQELQNGIAAKDKTINTDGIWFANSAFMTTQDLNSTFKVKYGGVNCGLHFSFLSPYPFEFTNPQKDVSGSGEYTSNDTLEYSVSQYVPNNYYSTNIKFNEIYPNLYDDTRLKKLVIEDNIPSTLSINGNVKVYDENNVDVSSKFNTSIAQQKVTSTVNSVNFLDSTFYNHTYTLKIPVKVREGTNVKTVSNYSTTSISSDLAKPDIVLNSNTKNINIYYNVLVEYRDNYDDSILDSETMKKYPGDAYATTQKSISGYDYYNTSGDSISGTIADKNIKVTYYYKKKSTVTANHYLLDSSGNNPTLIDSDIQNKYYGDDYTTSVSDKINLNYYYLREQPSGSSGNIKSDSIVVDYYYVLRKSNIVVHHYKDGTTDKLANDDTYTIDYGKGYETHEQVNRNEKNYVLSRIVGDPAEGTVEKDNIEVTYYYKLRSSIIEATLEKRSVEEINELNKSITYNIVYNAKIKDYEGDVTVRIIDTLPYKINLEGSDLNGGTYDENSNTITWIEDWNDILATSSGSVDKKIEKEITVLYTDLDVHTKDIYNRVLGSASLSTIEKEEEINTYQNTSVKIPSKVIVHYYLDGTTDKLANDDYLNGYVDEILTSKAKDISGYKLVNKNNSNKHLILENDTEYIYYYSKILNVKKEDNPNTSVVRVLFIINLMVLLFIVYGIYKFVLKKKIYKL